MKIALSLEQLREIQQRNLKNRDAMTLLREIKRLQELIVHAEWYALKMQACVPEGAAHPATGTLLRVL